LVVFYLGESSSLSPQVSGEATATKILPDGPV
jgi:hypothetical protein